MRGTLTKIYQNLRKGVPGDWRTVFDTEDIKMFRNTIGDYPDFLGYTLER